MCPWSVIGSFVAKQSVPKRGSVGSACRSRDVVAKRTRRYRVSVLTVLPHRVTLYSLFGPISFLLNIFNIRSVITNPPTTFVVEQTTAMNPRMVLTVL
jgi:hypothetical protein